MRRALAALGLLAPLMAAVPARAEWPAGWESPKTLPSALPSPPTPQPKSRKALFGAFHPERPKVHATSFDVAKLPRIETGRPVPAAVQRDVLITFSDYATRNAALARGERVDARLSMRQRVYGSIGTWETTQPILPRGLGGLERTCGGAARGEQKVHFESLKPELHGVLLYENARMIFDRQTCTARVTEYYSARALPVPLRGLPGVVIPGLVWAFRSTSPGAPYETLHVIAPPSGRRASTPVRFFDDDAWLTHIELPLGPGRGAAVALRISTRRPKAWANLGVPAPRLRRPLLGIQVSQTVDAAQPTLVLSATEAPDT